MHMQLPAGCLPDHLLSDASADLPGTKLGAALHVGSRDDVSAIVLLRAGYNLRSVMPDLPRRSDGRRRRAACLWCGATTARLRRAATAACLWHAASAWVWSTGPARRWYHRTARRWRCGCHRVSATPGG